MAISPKTLATLAALAKVDVKVLEDAQKAATDTDVDIAGDLTSLTAAELQTRDQNNKESGKSGYITAGKEIAIKDLKAKAGLDYDGKDIDTFLAKHKDAVLKEAKVNPDQRVQELQQQVDTLRTTQTKLEGELTQAKAQGQISARNAKILANLPKNRNSALSDEDYLLLLNNRLIFETTADGKEQIKGPDGRIYQNTKAEPLGLSEVLNEVFTKTAGWLAAPGKDGRGGKGDPPPGGGGGTGDPTSYTEAEKAWTESGKGSTNSAAFSSYVSSLASKNKDFVMDIGGQAPPAADPGASGSGS